jgi:hypothetical protein
MERQGDVKGGGADERPSAIEPAQAEAEYKAVLAANQFDEKAEFRLGGIASGEGMCRKPTRIIRWLCNCNRMTQKLALALRKHCS